MDPHAQSLMHCIPVAAFKCSFWNAVHLHLVCTLTQPPQPPVCHAGTLGDVFVFITKRLGRNEAHKAFAALLVLLPHAAAELLLHLQSNWSPHVLLRSSKLRGGHYGPCIVCPAMHR